MTRHFCVTCLNESEDARKCRQPSVKLVSHFLYLDKNESSGSLFIKYTDYPLSEERTLECFSPLNDVFKSYNFKKYDANEIINEEITAL